MNHRSVLRRMGAGVAVAALAPSIATAVATPATAAPPTRPYISELHYDNAGTDTGEFVEVHVPPGATTAGWTLVLYNGSSGVVYDTDPVPPASPPIDGQPQAVVVTYPANGIQNGSPDGIALVDPSGEVIELLSYEGAFTASDGPAAGRTTSDIGVAETSSTPAGQSLARRYSPAQDALVWQAPAPATPGQPNAPLDQEPEPGVPCEEAPSHEIGAVQGAGGTTPLAGQTVTVRGVVVGDTAGLGGFYLQDPDGDGSPATSDGVFVAGAADVGLGDVVQVTGRPREGFGETQLSSPVVEVCDARPTAADLPPAAVLDLPSGDPEREVLEGMLVAPADVLTVSEVYDLTRFGELTLSEGGILVQPTELARPGPEAQAIAAANIRRAVVLDDGQSARTSPTNRPYLSPASPVRVGDQLTFTAPTVLGYGFSRWRLQPADGTAEGTFAPQNTRPAGPEEVAGDTTVGAFNVLNYFLTFSGPDARGARSADQLERQAAKIVTAITALDADVVALMEIEDTNSTGYGDGSPDQALVDLVRRLNAAATDGATWAHVPLPAELLAVDRDVIRNAIVYRSDVVRPVGDPVGLVDEAVWYNAREPIAQTFTKDGDAFTVVANHFKSKSPGEPSGDNVDRGDGQGAWNGDRVRQARSLAAFAERLRADTGDDDVLVVGDLNAYSREDPIVALEEAGFTDLGRRFDPDRFSYVFDDLSGSLDHAMATSSLLAKVTGAVHWNINAVESFAYQYSGDPALYAPHQYRSSDHDPLRAGIDLVETCFGLVPTIVGTDGDDALRGTNGDDVIVGLGGDDVIDGLNGDDVVCGGAGDDVVRGGNGVDRLAGGFGDDRLDGGNGDDRLVGGPGADDLDGGRGADDDDQDGPDA